MQKPEAAAEN